MIFDGLSPQLAIIRISTPTNVAVQRWFKQDYCRTAALPRSFGLTAFGRHAPDFSSASFSKLIQYVASAVSVARVPESINLGARFPLRFLRPYRAARLRWPSSRREALRR
jgi:hypothetical protein